MVFRRARADAECLCHLFIGKAEDSDVGQCFTFSPSEFHCFLLVWPKGYSANNDEYHAYEGCTHDDINTASAHVDLHVKELRKAYH